MEAAEAKQAAEVSKAVEAATAKQAAKVSKAESEKKHQEGPQGCVLKFADPKPAAQAAATAAAQEASSSFEAESSSAFGRSAPKKGGKAKPDQAPEYLQLPVYERSLIDSLVRGHKLLHELPASKAKAGRGKPYVTAEKLGDYAGCPSDGFDKYPEKLKEAVQHRTKKLLQRAHKVTREGRPFGASPTLHTCPHLPHQRSPFANDHRVLVLRARSCIAPSCSISFLQECLFCPQPRSSTLSARRNHHRFCIYHPFSTSLGVDRSQRPFGSRNQNRRLQSVPVANAAVNCLEPAKVQMRLLTVGGKTSRDVLIMTPSSAMTHLLAESICTHDGLTDHDRS